MTHKKPSLGRGLADLLGASRARAFTPPASVPVTPAGAPAAQAPQVDGAAAAPDAADNAGASSVSPAAPASAASSPAAPASTSAPAPRGGGDELSHLPLESLQRGKYQPRVDMRQEALEELAISIRNQGLIQPIVVRPLTGAAPDAVVRYEIIAGERRWRAAQIAGLKTIPSVIRRVPDEAAIAMALIENIQREDLNPLEEARALERLIAEFGVTHQQAAEAVGRSRTAVTNLLRLLELAPDVAMMVEKRQLEMGHARALLALTNRREQLQTAQLVARDGLSVRATEALVRRLAAPPGSTPDPGRKGGNVAVQREDPNVLALQQQLSEKLGAKVLIQQESGGKGRLVISYNSLEELDGILGHFKS